MHRKKKYVLGTGGAILRFFLMVPGVILLLIGLIGILGSGGAAAGTAEARKQAKVEFSETYKNVGVSDEIIQDVWEDNVYNGDRSLLSTTERQLILDMESDMVNINMDTAAGGLATAAGGFFSVGMLIGGLFFMAFGFIIGIRKWKLVCDNCGTAINAA